MRDSEMVNSVAWRLDGTLLASAGNNGLVRLWQPDGEPVRSLKGHTSVVVGCVRWSPDGRRLASASPDGTVRLWDGDGIAGPVLPAKGVWSLSWSPDSQRLASRTYEGTIGIWECDGKAGPVLQKPGSACGLYWSSDGQPPASDNDANIRLWGQEGGQGPVLYGKSGSRRSVCWSPDGRRLAEIGGINGEVWCFGGEGKVGRSVSGPAEVRSLAWSLDGQRLASGSADGLIRLWGGDGRLGPVLRGHFTYVQSLSWSPDGQHLASGSVDGTVRLWGSDGTPGSVLRSHTNSVNSVSWSADGQHLASGGADGTVRLWDGQGKPGPVLPAHPGQGGVNCVSWSPDSRRLASGGNDFTVRLWESDGKAGPVLEKQSSGVASVSWSPDGGQLASVQYGGQVRLWNGDGKPVAQRKHEYTSWAGWGADGLHLLSLSDGRLRLWGPDDQPGPSIKEPRGGFLPAVAWHGAGQRIALGFNDGTFQARDAGSLDILWSAMTFRCGRSAVFSPAGQLLFGYPGVADKDFVYVAQTEAGRFELYTPSEFQKLARRDGKPLPLFGPQAAPPGRPVDDVSDRVGAAPAAPAATGGGRGPASGAEPRLFRPLPVQGGRWPHRLRHPAAPGSARRSFALAGID